MVLSVTTRSQYYHSSDSSISYKNRCSSEAVLNVSGQIQNRIRTSDTLKKRPRKRSAVFDNHMVCGALKEISEH